ncbi:hypothetical protein DAPPUDRAFT_304283 [Daphnia pulex]|uniref:Uncharacterized protein n=1 Tax=Daphnia pulex TaxID=6669 RepID=E9GKV0_DAPPU|nr:hypothetical protein DAPPUDRAFT_304283 [Daphnia pulex]|eukprot:EFX79743.1 hypothetical protein DAPPUDRAFT_304283 [Daphnia pulex]
MARFSNSIEIYNTPPPTPSSVRIHNENRVLLCAVCLFVERQKITAKKERKKEKSRSHKTNCDCLSIASACRTHTRSPNHAHLSYFHPSRFFVIFFFSYFFSSVQRNPRHSALFFSSFHWPHPDRKPIKRIWETGKKAEAI